MWRKSKFNTQWFPQLQPLSAQWNQLISLPPLCPACISEGIGYLMSGKDVDSFSLNSALIHNNCYYYYCYYYYYYYYYYYLCHSLCYYWHTNRNGILNTSRVATHSSWKRLNYNSKEAGIPLLLMLQKPDFHTSLYHCRSFHRKILHWKVRSLDSSAKILLDVSMNNNIAKSQIKDAALYIHI